MAELIHLSYGETKAVITTEGAQLVSFMNGDGREKIWQADPAVWNQHAPVLFPVCGAPKDGKVIIDGVAYAMPKHGFTRVNPVFERSAYGPDFVELLLRDNEETHACYPFCFDFLVSYELFDHGIRTSFRVKNRDQKTMPFCVGGHPAFICPMEENAVFDDYDVIFSEQEDGVIAATPGGGAIDGEEILPFFHDGHVLPLNHHEIDIRDSWLFSGLNSRSVRLENRKTGHGLTMHFPKMEALAIWSAGGKNADYVCLEPWHGIPATRAESGRFEDKPFVTLLSPGETYVTWFDVIWDR